jgi:hypothetical protein
MVLAPGAGGDPVAQIALRTPIFRGMQLGDNLAR